MSILLRLKASLLGFINLLLRLNICLLGLAPLLSGLTALLVYGMLILLSYPLALLIALPAFISALPTIPSQLWRFVYITILDTLTPGLHFSALISRILITLLKLTKFVIVNLSNLLLQRHIPYIARQTIGFRPLIGIGKAPLWLTIQTYMLQGMLSMVMLPQTDTVWREMGFGEGVSAWVIVLDWMLGMLLEEMGLGLRFGCTRTPATRWAGSERWKGVFEKMEIGLETEIRKEKDVVVSLLATLKKWMGPLD